MLRQLRMQNYRCFDDHTIFLEPNAILVGRNNAGKSSIIEALRILGAVVNRKGAAFVPAPKWLELPHFRLGIAPGISELGLNLSAIFHIISIKERILPDIDDNLVKDVSDKFSTLDQLKESIRLRLTLTAKRRYEYLKQETITKALIERNPFLVPPALIERAALSLINRELETMGEKASSEIVKNYWQEIWDSVQERAQFRVKAELLFEALTKSLEIKVTEEEILNKVNSLKNISKEDAEYSLEIEKLLNLIEQQGQVTIINEPLIQKDQ